MKIIEITGIPGAGKSSVLPVVIDYFKSRGIEIYDRHNIIRCSKNFPFARNRFKHLSRILTPNLKRKLSKGLNRYFSLRYPHMLDFLLQNTNLITDVLSIIQSRPIPPQHKKMILDWYLSIIGSYQIAIDTLNDDSFLILDEGFVHKAVSLFVSVEEPVIDFSKVDKYLNSIPEIYSLIIVKASVKECVSRIQARKLPNRLKGNADSDILEYIKRSEIVFNYIENKFHEKQHGKILEIQNNKSRFIYKDILDQISEHFSSKNFSYEKV